MRPFDWANWTLHACDPIRYPSSPSMHACASRTSANSMNANPGGERATHTEVVSPKRRVSASISCCVTDGSRLPTYTRFVASILQSGGQQAADDGTEVSQSPRV